jgi:hypothetical protein
VPTKTKNAKKALEASNGYKRARNPYHLSKHLPFKLNMKFIAIATIAILAVSATPSYEPEAASVEKTSYEPVAEAVEAIEESAYEPVAEAVEAIEESAYEPVAEAVEAIEESAYEPEVAAVEQTSYEPESTYEEPKSYIARTTRTCDGEVLTVVQEGDNLWDLAKEHDHDFEALLAANAHLEGDFDLIFPGDEVCIPAGCAKFSGPESSPYGPAIDPINGTLSANVTTTFDETTTVKSVADPAGLANGSTMIGASILAVAVFLL